MNTNTQNKILKLSTQFDPTTNATQKLKKKLVLTSSTNFQPSPDVQKKLEETNKQKQLEEEKIKKEQELQEQQRLLELRKAKPYEKQQLVTQVAFVSEYLVENSQKDDPNKESNKLLKVYGFLLQTLETVINFFQKDEWQKLKERKHFNIKEIAIKNQPRKDGKANTYSKTQQSTGGINQRPSHKPTAHQPFEKGTNFEQSSEQREQPKVVKIERVQDDIATKLKKDEMKAQGEEFFEVFNRPPEQKEKINKELNYRLNQLAPDNYDSISQKIVELLVENTVDGETCYLKYVAERIIAKAQTEPKYRGLYAKLCAMLAKDSRLEVTKPGKNGQEGKKISLFKNELLGQVSSVFYDRGKQEDITHLKPEEKEQYHLKRKAKIMGTARFIGELFLKKLLPVLAIEYALQELIGRFILNYTQNQENSEEQIERMVELLDQIGSDYEKQIDKQFDQTQIFNFFNGQAKTKAELEAFFKIFEKVLSMDLVMTILDALVKSYKLSERIKVLIGNVQERKKQGWPKKQEEASAQTSTSIQIEQEKEQIEQNYTQSKNEKRQNQEVIYVEKTSSQQSSYVQQQQFDLNKLEIYVKGTFTMEPEQQEIILIAELAIVGQCDEALLKFYETFFQQMFNRINKNIVRSQLVFELLSKDASKEEIVRKATQKVLTKNKLYDLAEAPVARDLFIDIIGPFLNETDPKNLRKLYFKPVDDIDEFTTFMTDIAAILIQKFPDKENLIRDYYEILGFSF